MSEKPPFDPSQPWTTAPADTGNVSGKPPFDPSQPFTTEPPPLSWSDVPSKALANAPASAIKFGSDIAQPFIHPIDTIENIGLVGHGLAQKLGVAPEGGHEDEVYADAVGKFFANRYGSMEGLKKTLAEDPVGFAGDLSMLLTGGETALGRVPGLVGKLGEVAGTVGRAVDPITGATRLATPVARETVGLMSGIGPDAYRAAYEAGQQGEESARAFRENISGRAPLEDTVAEARGAVSQMRRERGNAYRQQMQRVGADNTILSWNDVDTALRDMEQVATYKGQSLSPSTEAIRDRLYDAVHGWKNLRASEFWTPEGFDALKKKVGDIRDATQYGTPERTVADQLYNSIRQTIIDQVPDYARVMKGYEQASAHIREIERTLAVTPGASIDTTLRKLQSALRNNVNTSFGRRKELAEYLVNAGAPHLMQRLAGQALSEWAPRGLSRIVYAEGIPAAVGALAHGATGAGIGTLATLPLMSPRLMGEASYRAGQVSRYLPSTQAIRNARETARQIGRLNQENTP
jgi:hypothetical protein